MNTETPDRAAPPADNNFKVVTAKDNPIDENGMTARDRERAGKADPTSAAESDQASETAGDREQETDLSKD